MSKPRIIRNPVNGETITFLKTTEETGGEYFSFQLEFDPNGGVPYHLQQTYDEHVTVLKGELSTMVNGEYRKIPQGEKISFLRNIPHRFWSESEDKVLIEIEVRPARYFEQAMRIGDGLAEDGRANKLGLPKNLLHMAVIQKLTESYLAGLPIWPQKALFKPLYLLARRTGVEKKLMNKYL